MQSILPEQFMQLMDECSQIAAVLHRSVPRGIHVEESRPPGKPALEANRPRRNFGAVRPRILVPVT